MPRVNQEIDVIAEVGDAATLGIVARVWPIDQGACYTITCNGTLRGQECSERPDVLIEDGDTWQAIDAAVEFACGHIAEHEGRGSS